MKFIFQVLILCFFTGIVQAQSDIRFNVKDAATNEPLVGATVSLPALSRSASTDAGGAATLASVPGGRYLLEVRFVGYQTKKDSVFLPLAGPLAIALEPSEGETLDDVFVSSTRSTRTISNIPTRVEVIAGEELDEKGNMKPGDIRMVLNESTGIQTQQTSPTSGNASIRIQGLDGRYTQILKDGFPVYAGAASGLGLLQTPPLDLKQVEVIKGSASTLYGGGAIAGLVNLVSKTPGFEPELSAVVNVTSAAGLDLSGFYGRRDRKTGFTLFAARNSSKAYAPGSTVFSAIPKFDRYTLNPKLYLWFNEKTSLDIGLSMGLEDREGGDLAVIRGVGDADHTYFEKNKSERVSSQLSFLHRFSDKSQLSIRNSVSYFDRRISIPAYRFDGSQVASFSEATYAIQQEKAEWVIGANLVTDNFREHLKTTASLRDYDQTTFGAFIQNSVHISDLLEIESGLRGDYVADYGFSLLPRVSALFRFTSKLTSRIGGGLGYKAPTIFTEESERIQYQGVQPVSATVNKLERSYGANWDLNFRTALSERLSFSLNHLLFYTRLENPLILRSSGSGYLFDNVNGHFDSKGMETNVKLTYADLKLLIGYTLTDASLHSGSADQPNPLTAKHRLNNVLMYEAEDKWKLGLEAYYYSRQNLNDGTTGNPYWITGFMAEKLWEHFSLFVNFENFSDTRQTRFDTIYTGTTANPVFRDVYAPLDGFVVNGGIKLRL